MKTSSILQILLAAAIALTATSCKKKNDGSGDDYYGGGFDPSGGGGDPYGQGGAGGYGSGGAGGGGGYNPEIPLSGRTEGSNFYGSNVNRNMFQPVYFGFDSYQIGGSELGKVQQVAHYLRNQGQGQSLIIAGHTDQVGTDEYNRNLGELRALAVRSALVQMGVEAGRVQTVSYGEDMPAQAGNDNANRRAEFGVVTR